ncbi:hypothetical protein HZC09_01825 [Candidatus Micrarchaeota archaeon]|nr:hypothetical protein [Candidatus Micrarchaeota archaeon]
MWPASPDGKQERAAYLHTNIVVEPRDKLAADILNRVDEKRAKYGSMLELLGIVRGEINRREKQIRATMEAHERTSGAGWRLFAFTKEAEKLKSLKEKLREKQEDLERTRTRIPL